jgi:hypothetical protein
VKTNNRRIGILHVIIISIIVAAAFPIVSYNLAAKSSWKVISSNDSLLVVSVEPKFDGFDTLATESGQKVLYPRISEGFCPISDPASPLSLQLSETITVPSPGAFKLLSAEVSGVREFQGTIAPASSYFLKYDGSIIPDVNDRVYSGSTVPSWAEVKYVGIARNRYIGSVNINVSRYYAQRQVIEIPARIIIKIAFYPERNYTNNNTASNNDFSFTLNDMETLGWRIPPVIAVNNPVRTKNTDQLLTQSNGQWLRVPIETEGIYKIDKSQLSSMGFNISPADVPTIKLYGNGGAELSETVTDAPNNLMQEQAIIVKTETDGNLQSIIFYAAPPNGFTYNSGDFRHFINVFSTKNYYMLTFGGSQGKRQIPVENPQGTPVNTPNTYIQRVFFEEELNNAIGGGSGRTWFGRTIFPSIFTNQLPNLDRQDSILYRIAVAHKSVTNGTFYIDENGTDIASIPLSGFTYSYQDAVRSEVTMKKPASIIASDDRSILKFSYSNINLSTSTAYFDSYEIHYHRNFVAINNEIGFFEDPYKTGLTEYNLGGFSGDIYGFDITNRANPIQLTNIATTGGTFIYRNAQVLNTPRQYFISSNIKSASIEKADVVDLRNNFANTDLIIITHPSLIKSATAFRDYRVKQSNITATVITTEQIYNEFNSGLPDPTAIRDFLAFAYHNWQTKPKYALFWGDGHWDYRNIQSNVINFIPPYESIDATDAIVETDSYTTDDFYVRIEGNDALIDMAIGRLPITSDESGMNMITKINHYENASSPDAWRSTVTLLADDSPAGLNEFNGDMHTVQSEELSKNHVPLDYQQNKIYLAEYPVENVPGGRRKPRVTEDMVSTVNTTGTLLLNWVGHGNPRVWAHEEIFERSLTIPLMTNLDKMFFCVAATCDFARFDMPDAQSGAEELVTSKIGGAIGVLSATRLVNTGENQLMNDEFYDDLFKRDGKTGMYRRLGDVMFDVKQKRYGSNDQRYNLIGDPSLRLHLPDDIITIDSINGIYIASGDTISLKAMSETRIAAHVTDPVTNETVTGFNGIAILTMLDCDENIVAVDIDNTQHHILTFGGALNHSSYKVESGIISSDFIIPKDISFMNTNGRLFIQAYSSDTTLFAKGSTRNFTLGGIVTGIPDDNSGPDINIYLDARTFKPGDIVNSIPLLIVDLHDKSGINSTGLGIGHRIEAWIDNSTVSIDLTSKFSTSLTDSRSGTVEQLLFNLKPGRHDIKVRAWDVFNNYSYSETYFNLALNDQIFVINDLGNYPNPFDVGTTISFKHNIMPPFDVNVNIYDVFGNSVRTINQTIGTLNAAEIPWDGFGDSGKSLPTGAYLYHIRAVDNQGIEVDDSQIMLMVK